MIKSLTKKAASLLGLEIRTVNGGQTTRTTLTEELPGPTPRRLPAGRLKGLAPRFFDDQNEAVEILLPTA